MDFVRPMSHAPQVEAQPKTTEEVLDEFERFLYARKSELPEVGDAGQIFAHHELETWVARLRSTI